MSAGSFTTADGCLLAYEDSGTGLPVIWLHGLGADRQQPAEVFPDGSGRRRITLECRGHGQSQIGDPARLSIEQFAEDVLALIDHLGIERAVAGGISLGAAISLRLAATAPSRILALVLARPAWVDQAAPATMRPYFEVAELLRDLGRKEGLRRFVQSPTYSTVSDVSPDNAASLCSFFAPRDEASTIELLSRIPMDGPGVSERALRSTALPTLVIGNGEEYVHPVRYARALAELIPEAKLRIVTSKTIDKALYKAQFREALAEFLQALKVAACAETAKGRHEGGLSRTRTS